MSSFVVLKLEVTHKCGNGAYPLRPYQILYGVKYEKYISIEEITEM